MQVSATLIAAQQAAREARARLQVPQAPQQTAQAGFAAALDKTAPAGAGFSALPLKQTAPSAQAPTAQPASSAPARMGQHVNILV